MLRALIARQAGGFGPQAWLVACSEHSLLQATKITGSVLCKATVRMAVPSEVLRS